MVQSSKHIRVLCPPGPVKTRRNRNPQTKIEQWRDVLPEAGSGLSSTISYSRRQVITEEAERAKYLFQVMAGTLRAAKLLPDGRRHITNFLVPGDLFGFTNNGHYLETVEAIDDVTLIRCARERFERIARCNLQMGYRLYSALGDALFETDEHLLLLARKSAEERIATFLLWIAQRASKLDRHGKREIVLRMSRNDIADYLGLSTETVSRTFTRLGRQKVISVSSRGRVTLARPRTLLRISNCYHLGTRDRGTRFERHRLEQIASSRST